MSKDISNEQLGNVLTDALNKRIKYESVQLKDLNQFEHLTKKGQMPHETIKFMINHNQKLNDTLVYLSLLVADIAKYQAEDNNNG